MRPPSCEQASDHISLIRTAHPCFRGQFHLRCFEAKQTQALILLNETVLSMSSNPYSAPPLQSTIQAAPSTEIASQGKRFLNTIIDNLLIQVFGAVGGFALGFAYVVAKGGVVTPADDLTLRVLGYMIGIAIAMSYYILMEGLFQRTPAKFLTNTKVVREDGSPPGFAQIVGRSFARLIPFEAFSFFGGPNPVGWHDSLSKTRVVRAS